LQFQHLPEKTRDTRDGTNYLHSKVFAYLQVITNKIANKDRKLPETKESLEVPQVIKSLVESLTGH